MSSMFARRAPFSALILLLYMSGAIAEKECTVHEDGKFYDLNPLKSKKDYEIKTSGGQKISLNVCQSVRTELFGLKDDINAGDVGAFMRRDHGDFAFGKVNTTPTVFDGRPRYTLSGGSRCKPKDGGQPVEVRASALVEFVCDMSVIGPGTPRLLAQLPPGDDEAGCAYVIEWKTHYACPTSEGGVWGFFAMLAVIFLVLLMTYTVLGTLYNRFVLQLRGFDQIPQFSVESMKYHGSEALDWIKDVVANLDIGGHASGGAAGGYNGRSSTPIPTTNPVSHQSQVFGTGDSQEGAAFGGGGGGFIRPQASRTRSAAFQRFETNPVSHQSQVNAQIAQSLSFSTTEPHSPSPPIKSPTHPESSIPQIRRSGPPDFRGSTKDERDFMLVDDEDAEELGDISAPPPLPQKSASSPPPPQGVTPNISTTNSGGSEENPAAALRGRDLGGGDVILL